MQQTESIIRNNINLSNDIIILDVDRTIINTTSWYKACIEEDLLLSKANIKQFKILNDQAFKNPTKDNLQEFRKQTLNLIEKETNNAFIKKISTITTDYFNKKNYTNIWRFYVAGKYTALNIVKIYDDAIKYIEYCSRYYGDNLKVIFLSSGYEPFIRGVVDGILYKNNIKELNYMVIGSRIKINKGIVKEEYHIDQYDKEKIINNIIINGGKIHFLADDSDENEGLFKTVEDNNGIALKIKHIPNQQSNETWKKYLETLTPINIKEKLKNDISNIGLKQENIEIPEFLQKLSKDTNKIGITYLLKKDFFPNLEQLTEKIKDNNDRITFKSNFEKLIFEKEDIIYLRGRRYYCWLPQYIFIDNKSIIERWKELQTILECCLKIINKHNILNLVLNYYENIIIYTLIDHLIESLLFILNLLQQNDLMNKFLLNKETHMNLIETIQYTMDFMYAFFYEDKRESTLLNRLIRCIDELQIVYEIPDNIQTYKTMRELDNNITIFKFVKSVADDIEKKRLNIDYVFSFSYGAISLGFAIKAYMKMILNKKSFPNLINCHYSSKQKIRENRIERDEDFSIFKFIPSVYNEYATEIAKGNNKILLLDNNVTTFKTLDLNKNFLKKINNAVYTAVAEINYDNIVNYLLNKKNEKLIPKWKDVLDFKAVSEYTTAFNTWNTSQKSKILEEIYCTGKPYVIQDDKLELKNNDLIFKACRVHNVLDLNTIVKNGFNMIGIHAAYPDRIKYLNNELKYKPCKIDLDQNEKLPIALLEIESIRDMQNYIPQNIKQAVLFEKPLDIMDMIEVCNIYQMRKGNMYIQLQHRTNEEYIKNIKQKLCKNIIATIGLFQKDFKENFWEIHNSLNEGSDYILLDLSKHQPDLIQYSEEYKEDIDRVEILNNVAKFMEGNKVSIIIADDTTPVQMSKYLNIISKYNIRIKGIDMQNCIEIKQNEQRYQMIDHNGNIYQTKLRKSPNYIKDWNKFINNIKI